MSIEQTNPKSAWARLSDENDDCVYLDVRSVKEFETGHPKGAYNIPIMFMNESGQMAPNENFIEDVKSKFSADKSLLLGCKSGGRSQRGCDALDQAGFENLQNVQGGFLGTGPNPGWSQEDLPKEDGSPEERSYTKKGE
ncbi:MAG: rhodanese-like domain-containing protein [Candidatus Lindowbacteria bacterium]|nr:rhodanese-like domain-containing protein [Candidatus Lindowbacteria bacterium]